MRTYRELLGVPEFSALFTASSAQAAASTVTGLALATLVYSATGSPLLSALVMFGLWRNPPEGEPSRRA